MTDHQGQSDLELALDMKPAHRALGLKIEAVRIALNLSQGDLCARTKLGTSTISAIENGRQTVSLEQLALIGAALNITPDILIKGIFR